MSRIAIVDYGMGNLFSVLSACRAGGVDAEITDDPEVVAAAPGAVLPGVGGFPDAMRALRNLGLAGALTDIAGQARPVLGICLGMQLMLAESEEFGRTAGLGLIAGRVVPMKERMPEPPSRIPHIGWSALHEGPAPWAESPLHSIDPGRHAYFVHSFIAEPDDPSIITSWTEYGGLRFCSSFQAESLFACQFHPERSGRAFIETYRAMFSGVAHPPESEPT